MRDIGVHKYGALGVIIAALVLASPLFVTSCQTPADSFAVDSVVVDRSWAMREAMANDELGGRSYYYALVDYPLSSDTIEYRELTDSVRVWISRQLLPSGSKPILSKRVLDEAANVFFGEEGGNEWGANMSIILRKVYEDDCYVSYDASEYTFYGGAAHGMCNIYGATFRKCDGSRFTWSDVGDIESLRRKVTNSMMRERGDATVGDLMKSILFPENKEFFLSDNSPALPLPKVDPWLTKDGWVFSYQPYEMMCWAEGAPACRLRPDEVDFK